jgi:hypothetical protein
MAAEPDYGRQGTLRGRIGSAIGVVVALRRLSGSAIRIVLAAVLLITGAR